MRERGRERGRERWGEGGGERERERFQPKRFRGFHEKERRLTVGDRQHAE